MIGQGLSLDQAPPIHVPFRFFLTAPIFGMIAAVRNGARVMATPAIAFVAMLISGIMDSGATSGSGVVTPQ